MSQNGLVFDLGAHLGRDTSWYLSKGYKVVAVEAHPHLANRLKLKYQSSACTIIEAAISDDAHSCQFYMAPHLGETSSCQPHRVRGRFAAMVTQPTVTVPQLIQAHGLPDYVKIDLEGNDLVALKQLYRSEYRPRWLSVELSIEHKAEALEIASVLSMAGYLDGQLVNQCRVREGLYGEEFAGGGFSGPFGSYLPKHRWHPLCSVLEKFITRNPSGEWYDLHVEHSDYLQGGKFDCLEGGNSADLSLRTKGIGGSRWQLSGVISGEERSIRVTATTKDVALKLGHDKGMTVRECRQI